MGIKLSDHIDIDDVEFKTLRIFWDVGIYSALADDLGRDLVSEEEYISLLSSKGKEDYLEVKSRNPDWEFPEWLNRKNMKAGKKDENEINK